MIHFYFAPSPNPLKVALFLEEVGLPYVLNPIDTKKGDQHTEEFKAINPNAKTPAIVDGNIRIFDSNAILLYLGEKTGQFMPEDTLQSKASMYSWLMFVATGIGPYCGQAVHFKHFAPEPKDYSMNRYDFEAWRHWKIVDDLLSTQTYMLGDKYTLVDMSIWGWARMIPFILGPDAWEQLPNVKRLLDQVNTRPAAQKAESLKNQHVFKTEFDDESRRHLFPSNTRLKSGD